MDINIRKPNFEDARPKISEVIVPIGFPKALYYWCALSRWAFILFAALAPIFFLPFTSLPVAVHKELLVFILILIAFFAILGRILIEGRVRYPGHLLMTTLLVLVLVWGVSTFFSFNQLVSLIGPWATPDSFFSMLLFVLLTLSIVMTFDRRDIVLSLLAFLASLSLLGLFESLQLLKIFILPFSFTKNIGFNPVGSVNDVGVLLAFGLIIASGLVSSTEISRLLKKLLGLAVLVFIINIVVIDFWAIWIGLALAMIFMISFLSIVLQSSVRRTDSPNRFAEPIGFGESNSQGLQLIYFQKAWLPTIILLVSLLFLFIPSPLSKFIKTPVEVSPTFRATLDIGIVNLKAGHYFLGSGPNTFGSIYNLYKPISINQTIFWSTTFNSGASAITTWVGTVGFSGILSLLFLIATFIWAGVVGRERESPLTRGEVEGFGAIETHPNPPLSGRGFMNVASQAIFVAVIFLFIMWFLYVVNFTVMAFTFWGMGLFLAASFSTHPNPPLSGREANSSPDKGRLGGVFKEIRIFTSPPKIFLFSLLIVGLMVIVTLGIYFEANRYIAEIYFSKAIAASGQNNNDGAINNISKAIEFWPYDERYFEALSQTVFSEINSLLSRKDLPQETLRVQFQNLTSNAIAYAQKAGALNPKNPFNAVLLGSVYENLIPFIADAANFALSSYETAAALDPKNPSDFLALARVQVAQANLAVSRKAGADEINSYLDKAIVNLETSLSLKGDYAPARFLEVQVYDREGKLTDAIKRAEELAVLNNSDVGVLFQLGFLYYKAGRYDDSKIVFERIVQLSPNYSNARYFLGLIYDREVPVSAKTLADRLAAKAKAIEQFAKIAELNPDNSEVKQILLNLKTGKAALFGIAPPLPAPQNRAEAPVLEGAKAPVQKLKK